MTLLSKREYLRAFTGDAHDETPSAVTTRRVLEYATGVWPGLALKNRKLKEADLVTSYRTDETTFFHVRAFPRKNKDTFVIIVGDATATDISGHILIDLLAEYAGRFLNCPSCEFSGVPTPDDIESLIPQITPDDPNPFAILETGDGTFMQTLCTDDGYVLEHQLVNTSSHYETPDLVSLVDVINAMKSYAFGNNEWLDAFDWRRQVLD